MSLPGMGGVIAGIPTTTIITAAALDADLTGYNGATNLAGGGAPTGGAISNPIFDAYQIVTLFDAMAGAYTPGAWFAVNGNHTGATFTSVTVAGLGTKARAAAANPTGVFDGAYTYWLWGSDPFGFADATDYEVTVA